MTERIHSIWDYYDCPRTGIAGFENDICFFECEWDTDADDYSHLYSIKKLNDDLIKLVNEYDEIWNEWNTKFMSGIETIDTHPANEEQNPRFYELQNILESAIENQPVSARRIPEFSNCDNHDDSLLNKTRKMEVVWKVTT